MAISAITSIHQRLADLPVLGSEVVATTIFVIGGTGMAVGGVIAFFLDNTIPGTREERAPGAD